MPNFKWILDLSSKMDGVVFLYYPQKDRKNQRKVPLDGLDRPFGRLHRPIPLLDQADRSPYLRTEERWLLNSSKPGPMSLEKGFAQTRFFQHRVTSDTGRQVGKTLERIP